MSLEQIKDLTRMRGGRRIEMTGLILCEFPSDLLQAISTNGGGRVALVIGAGCSVEPPTSAPLSKALAVETNRRLVLDGVLSAHECIDPEDLSALTTLVFNKTGSQSDIVCRFPLAKFKTAKPNRGYKLLAALMAERAVTYVLSLNFDLAVQNASSELGLTIEIVDQAGSAVSASPTLIHLHGNANSPVEKFVLRQETIDDAWKGQWEQLIANQILAAPIVLFSGLGSAAPVLSETVAMISNALGGNKSVFQADIVPHDQSNFAVQLGVAKDHYIESSWSELMETLAKRVASGRRDTFQKSALRCHRRPSNDGERLCRCCRANWGA